jgi:hypothetical protein
MWAIKEHPTYESVLREKLRPKKKLEIGDQTERGEIVEIGKDFIKTKGHWGNGEEIKEWKDVDNVKLSIDYGVYHDLRDRAEKILNQGRNILLQDEIPHHGSYGIYNPEVDESCRVAFDLIQVIRHEFWKADPGKSSMTVDSSVHLSTQEAGKIKCQIDKEL